VSVFYNRSTSDVILKVTQQDSNWALEIIIPKSDFNTYEIDENHVTVEDLEDRVVFKTNLAEFNLKLNF
jgi:hypothetical protein